MLPSSTSKYVAFAHLCLLMLVGWEKEKAESARERRKDKEAKGFQVLGISFCYLVEEELLERKDKQFGNGAFS